MSLDAHMWLETADGKIVNDQDFSQYDYVKRVRKCSGEKKYKAYEGEKAKKTLAKVQQMIQTRMDMMISVSAYTSSPKKKTILGRIPKNTSSRLLFYECYCYVEKKQTS